jgi:DNA-binding GntR family transcriptional regulator
MSRPTVSEAAYQQLRHEMLTWHRPPGSILAETKLSIDLKVSRTPLREAIQRLVDEGLAVSEPRRRARVTRVNIHHAQGRFCGARSD